MNRCGESGKKGLPDMEEPDKQVRRTDAGNVTVQP